MDKQLQLRNEHPRPANSPAHLLQINSDHAQFDGKPRELCTEQGELAASYRQTG